MITNDQIAEAFNQIADALELQDENPYRIRAYRRAAISLKKYPQEVSDLQDRILEIPNIGIGLAAKIKSIIQAGVLPPIPKEKPALWYPKKLKNTHRTNINLKIYIVMPIIEKIITRLKSLSEITAVEYAGSYRRKKELIDDIKIIIQTDNSKVVFDKFCNFSGIKYIIIKTRNSLTVQLKIGLILTLFSTSKKYFGGKLLHATGSNEHYNHLKQIAKSNNYILRSNGLYKNNHIIGETEALIYENLNLCYIPPELRENRGEIEAAHNKTLPILVELNDIKGDLHCHTNETDGIYSLEEMIEEATKYGYQYIAITDHSKSLKITHGMDEKRLLKQIKQINKLNEKFSNFTILKSMEVDILEDGQLDLDNSVLKELDLTVCSIHSKFNLSFEKQTERLLRAMDNPFFNILGHATGRLIQHRKPYTFDMDKILIAAKERNCIIEVNAQPARLDINDIYCKKAKEIGVKIAISSDAHTLKGFGFMVLGVNQARRGWMEAKDVINTYTLFNLKKILQRI